MLPPPTFAFNCNSLSGGDFYICNQIQGTDLSQIEKDLLISDIFSKNKTIPDFDFVNSWNTNLNIKNSPDNKYQNQGSIRNAWVKIIALMPSILENDTLYIPEQGKILIRYNYDVVLPSGTASGDCKTSYSLDSKKEMLYIYLNSKLIGQNQISSFSTDSKDNIFIAKLKIDVTYKIKHYKRNKYCAEYEEGKCVRYKSVCEYSYTETKTDILTPSSSLQAKLYESQPNSSFKITDKYSGITKGVLTAEDYTKVILSFTNSEFQNSRYIYSLNYSSPYYVLTIRADKIENTESNNIHVDRADDSFIFNVKDASGCKIELFDHFDSITKSCDMSFNPVNFSIKTDKTNYYENDTIKVYIEPSNLKVNLSYGNQNKIAENYAEFQAVLFENKIEARLNDQKADWLVNIKKKENAVLLYNLGILSFLGYFFYKTAKAYYEKFL